MIGPGMQDVKNHALFCSGMITDTGKGDHYSRTFPMLFTLKHGGGVRIMHIKMCI